VNLGNIEAGKEHNFDIRLGGTTLSPYDFGSIMHYPEDAFSDGGDTIEPLHGEDIGQRDGLSEFDIKGVCVLYDAPHVVVAWEDDLDRRDHKDVQWTGLARWGKHCWGPLRADSDGGGCRTSRSTSSVPRSSCTRRTRGCRCAAGPSTARNGSMPSPCPPVRADTARPTSRSALAGSWWWSGRSRLLVAAMRSGPAASTAKAESASPRSSSPPAPTTAYRVLLP
jgi:hypothetical protein